jgi:hypothetical protein
MLAWPDQQISLTDPDTRSMATSGRGSGVVGYNVQTAPPVTLSIGMQARRRSVEGAIELHVESLDISMLR